MEQLLETPEAGDSSQARNPGSKALRKWGSKSEFGHENLDGRMKKAWQKVLTPLPLQASLDEKCEVCLGNLELCIEKVHYAALRQTLWVSTKLLAVEQRLTEHRLRLLIWMSECLVSQKKLSVVRNRLQNVISQSFEEQNDQINMILRGITKIREEMMPLTGSQTHERCYAEALTAGGLNG